jgi:acyl dehydratase
MEIKKYKMDELFVGMEDSFAHRVTRDEIRRFTELVSDFHPLHSDGEYAARAGFRTVIVQGFFISSLASSLVSMKLPGERTLILSQQFNYLQPVYADENLVFKGKITKLEPRFSLATIEISVFAGDVKKSSGKIEVKVRDV